jgi:hypothetical protein
LFDDSDQSDPPQTTSASRPTETEGLVQKPQHAVIGPATNAQSPAEDEETIEQYMTKLLQRVRGDATPRAAAPVSAEPNRPPVQQGTSRPQTAEDRAAPPNTVNGPVTQEASEEPPAPCPDPVRRKAPLAQQTADLKAFRAVANETARRAISTHAIRKHRRNAMTKTIVATLAGMTSVLLMLEAPDWRDLQFIAACVSLVVAAYWAGQTFGTLMESLRAASYDGPYRELDSLADFAHPALPIDVDR